MVPSDRAVATFYVVGSNYVSICSGLAAIFNVKPYLGNDEK